MDCWLRENTSAQGVLAAAGWLMSLYENEKPWLNQKGRWESKKSEISASEQKFPIFCMAKEAEHTLFTGEADGK
ncbi:MAG TPA: hypothetical protein H9733_05975 [Candidatus Anaerotignum merdipullorum]|nr:hypothetical protein [Candidatus Anaerotignum merdipullorum]